MSNGEIIEVGVLNLFEQDQFAKKAVAFDYCILGPIAHLKSIVSFLKIGNFDSVREGDEIYTCGYPIGIKQQFVTRGIVSTKYVEDSNRSIFKGDTSLIPRAQALLDVTLNRGNSGGAIVKVGNSFDEDEVVGIADFIITPIGSQSEQIIELLKKSSGQLKIGGVDPNAAFASVFEIISSLSIGVSGCISINYLASLLVNNR